MRIGVIAPLYEELEPFAEAIGTELAEDFGEGSVLPVSFGWHQLFLCRSGVGKVNAARAAQSLLDRHQVEAVFNIGTAAAIAPGLNIGDVVVAEWAVQHDFDTTALGLAPGEVPLQVRLGPPSAPITRKGQLGFQASSQLVERARASAGRCSCLKGHDRQPKVHYGVVLSGDQFIASLEKRRYLHAQFGGLCVEMEGAAIAQVCDLGGVPFLIVRAISDHGEEASPSQFLQHFRVASANAACLAVATVASLPPNDGTGGW